PHQGLGAGAVLKLDGKTRLPSLHGRGQPEAYIHQALVIGAQYDRLGTFLAVGAIGLAIDVDVRSHRLVGDKRSALDARNLARGQDLVAGTIRLARKIQLLVEARILVFV